MVSRTFRGGNLNLVVTEARVSGENQRRVIADDPIRALYGTLRSQVTGAGTTHVI
jgi:hypothetical protein